MVPRGKYCGRSWSSPSQLRIALLVALADMVYEYLEIKLKSAATPSELLLLYMSFH